MCLSVPGNPLVQLTTVSSAAAAEQAATATAATRPAWAATATGRVEPKDGQIVIGTQAAGRVADVAVKSNDKVVAGDLLVRLEEDDQVTRVTAASQEVQVRERERDEEAVKGLQLERRQAEDSVAAAERSLYRARLAFDEIAFNQRLNASATGDLTKARFAIGAAKEQLANSRASLARVLSKEGVPLATRLESSLATARAELSLAEAAVERGRIRAPVDGTVLTLSAKFGEIVAPSPELVLAVIGDLRSLRVKAEVEERDATKVRVGQRVSIKSDAFPEKQFEGTVTSVSLILATPRIATRGVRRPNDVEVLEVIASLDGTPPLLSGMRVDVFFKNDGPAESVASSTPPATKTN
jgi:HlyD family secretion protein